MAISAEAAAGPGNGTPFLWSASIVETWEFTWPVGRCWATSSIDVEVLTGRSISSAHDEVETLAFCLFFDHSLRKVELPRGLQHLTFGYYFALG